MIASLDALSPVILHCLKWPIVILRLYFVLSVSQEELVEILLDHFQVEACYLQEQAVLAMYSYSSISGIVGELRSFMLHPLRPLAVSLFT